MDAQDGVEEEPAIVFFAMQSYAVVLSWFVISLIVSSCGASVSKAKGAVHELNHIRESHVLQTNARGMACVSWHGGAGPSPGMGSDCVWSVQADPRQVN